MFPTPFSTTVTLTCSPHAVNLEVKEEPSADSCLVPVNGTNITCTPGGVTAGGQTVFTKLGNDVDSFTVTQHQLQSPQGSFGVDICVNHTTFNLLPGYYQVSTTGCVSCGEGGGRVHVGKGGGCVLVGSLWA